MTRHGALVAWITFGVTLALSPLDLPAQQRARPDASDSIRGVEVQTLRYDLEGIKLFGAASAGSAVGFWGGVGTVWALCHEGCEGRMFVVGTAVGATLGAIVVGRRLDDPPGGSLVFRALLGTAASVGAGVFVAQGFSDGPKGWLQTTAFIAGVEALFLTVGIR